MSDNHETRVRRLIDEAWNKGNLQVLDDLVAQDYVNHDSMNQSKGLQGLKDTIMKYRSAFPDCRMDIEEMISFGDDVVVRWRYSGTHKNAFEGIAPTGRRATGTGMSIQRFAGGKLRETYSNWDALGLLQQLGVVTLPGRAAAAGR